MENRFVEKLGDCRDDRVLRELISFCIKFSVIFLILPEFIPPEGCSTGFVQLVETAAAAAAEAVDGGGGERRREKIGKFKMGG